MGASFSCLYLPREMSVKQYDVVVIGAGLGGLFSAVTLAKNGLKVCVLEKNRQIGGCLQTFALRKKVFDACVHYIGGLGEGHTLHRLFKYAGIINDLNLHELDSRGFDQILFGHEETRYPLGTRAHFVESLLPYFPQEEDALNRYLALISKVADQFPLYNLRTGEAEEKLSVMSLELLSTLRSLTGNERLVEVFAGNNMLYAGVEGQTPFYTHAMSTEAYLHSVRKVVPGSSQIARLLWRVLQKYGGEIYRHMEVVALKESGGAIEYAETADGVQWRARNYISAIHPAVLFSLTDSKYLRSAFRHRVGALPHTPPGVMVNLVLKPQTVPYLGQNVYWHPSGEVLAKETASGIHWPDTQALFYMEDLANPGFAESVSILVYADEKDFSRWKDSGNIIGVQTIRDKDYQKEKDAFADKLLEKTFGRFPELRDAVIARSIATPLTFRDYTGTPEGSLYGPMKDVARPAQTSLAVRTKISNLLLTGQNVNMHGVMGVCITAVTTCAELLGMEYLLDEIKKA